MNIDFRHRSIEIDKEKSSVGVDDFPIEIDDFLTIVIDFVNR